MEEFFQNNYSLLTRLVEFIAALTGVLSYNKYKHTPIKYFIYFLVGVLFLELIGSYPRYLKSLEVNWLEGTLFEQNYWIYTIFWKVGSVLFMVFFFRKILRNAKSKMILKYLAILFLLSTIIYYTFNFKKLFLHFSPYFVDLSGALIVLLCASFYFVEVLQTDKILSFYKSIDFYISATIFVWWLIVTPIIFYNIYYSASDWNFIVLKWQLYLSANIFMYLTFSFALLWCKPQKN